MSIITQRKWNHYSLFLDVHFVNSNPLSHNKQNTLHQRFDSAKLVWMRLIKLRHLCLQSYFLYNQLQDFFKLLWRKKAQKCIGMELYVTFYLSAWIVPNIITCLLSSIFLARQTNWCLLWVHVAVHAYIHLISNFYVGSWCSINFKIMYGYQLERYNNNVLRNGTEVLLEMAFHSEFHSVNTRHIKTTHLHCSYFSFSGRKVKTQTFWNINSNFKTIIVN
jgi:hypothetical protein